MKLYHEQRQLPIVERYVRYAERIQIPGEREVEFVILMTPEMSLSLMHARRFTMDSSFRKVQAKDSLEFEIESWEASVNRCKL